MRHRKYKSNKDSLKTVQLSIAKARLAKLEGDLPPPPTPEYTSYKDLPPLRPEEREEFKQELIDALTACEEDAKKKKYDWYMSMAHLAP